MTKTRKQMMNNTKRQQKDQHWGNLRQADQSIQALKAYSRGDADSETVKQTLGATNLRKLQSFNSRIKVVQATIDRSNNDKSAISLFPSILQQQPQGERSASVEILQDQTEASNNSLFSSHHYIAAAQKQPSNKKPQKSGIIHDVNLKKLQGFISNNSNVLSRESNRYGAQSQQMIAQQKTNDIKASPAKSVSSKYGFSSRRNQNTAISAQQSGKQKQSSRRIIDVKASSPQKQSSREEDESEYVTPGNVAELYGTMTSGIFNDQRTSEDDQNLLRAYSAENIIDHSKPELKLSAFEFNHNKKQAKQRWLEECEVKSRQTVSSQLNISKFDSKRGNAQSQQGYRKQQQQIPSPQSLAKQHARNSILRQKQRMGLQKTISMQPKVQLEQRRLPLHKTTLGKDGSYNHILDEYNREDNLARKVIQQPTPKTMKRKKSKTQNRQQKEALNVLSEAKELLKQGFNKKRYLYLARYNTYVKENLKEDKQIQILKKEFERQFKENEVEMYSDSDASDHRRDEIEINMDNAVITRLHEAYKKNSNTEVQKFKVDKVEKLHEASRHEQMAKKFLNWNEADSDNESDHQIKSISKIRHSDTMRLKRRLSIIKPTAINQSALLKSTIQKSEETKTSLKLQKTIKEREDLEYEYFNMKKTFIQEKKTVGSIINFIADSAAQAVELNQKKPKTRFQRNQRKPIVLPNDEDNLPEHLKISKMDPHRANIQVDLAKKVVEQMKKFELGQHSHKTIHKELLHDHPDIIYQNVVSHSKEVNLPLLSKVIDNKLILKDYTLDSGHLRGLAAAIQKAAMVINAVMFDNCGIDDTELAILLDGFSICDDFSAFIYKNNVFKEQGLAALKPILIKPDPTQLLELRLVNCVTSPFLIQDMLQFMVDQKVRLHSLALVRMQLNKLSLEATAQFLEHSEYIEDLDLSWNNLLANDFTVLFTVISNNKTLRSLNLSCNTIIDKADQNNEFDFKFDTIMEDYVERRRLALEAGIAYIPSQTVEKVHPMQAIYSFGRLIRLSTNLQSLILKNCGLNAQVLCGLVPSLRHAKSLLCLHLSNNPGLSQSTEQYYRERLKVLPTVSFKLKVTPEYLGPLSQEELAQYTPRSFELRNHKLKHQREWKGEELSKYLHTRRLRPLLNKQDAALNTDSKDLTITRILEKKEEMLGSGRWRLQTVQEQDSCWLCDNWIYTLYFWNEKIGQYNERNYIGIDKDVKATLVDSVRKYNKYDYLKHPDVPVLFSSTSSWKPQPFIKLLDFLDSLSPPKVPPFDSLVKIDAQEHFQVSKLEDLPADRQSEVDQYLKDAKEKQIQNWNDIRKQNAHHLIKAHVRYQKPALINFDKLGGNFGDVYVTPIMLPPGKNDFLIRAPNDQETLKPNFVEEPNSESEISDTDQDIRWYYRRHISNIREERVPFFAKQLRISKAQFQFNKELSVFKDWTEDNEEVLNICLDHDLKYWKIHKITKDSQQQEAILSIIETRYKELKDIFQAATCDFLSPPDFRMNEFVKFCRASGIRSSKVHTGIIDTYFKATNYEETDQDQNDDKALNRFEFLEILVRLARGKYMDFGGNMKHLGQALMRLLQTHVLPMQSQLIPVQSWRDNELWTNEVNDLLMVNFKSIQRAYQIISSSKLIRKYNRVETIDRQKISIDQIRYVLQARLHQISISEMMIVQAFYLSKMTVKREVDQGNYEYTYLHLPEFLEFLCRLAQLKYRDTYYHEQWNLQRKAKVILDHILSQFELSCVDPPEITEIISDSDDEF